MTEELEAGDAIICANQRGKPEIASSDVHTWCDRKSCTAIIHTSVVIRNRFTVNTVARLHSFSHNPQSVPENTTGQISVVGNK